MPPNGSLGSDATTALTKTAPGLDLLSHPQAPVDIRGPDRRTEAVRHVVGEPDGLVVVHDLDQRSDRSEGLLVVDRHARVHVGEHGWGVEASGVTEAPTTGEDARTTGQRLTDLPVDAVDQVRPGKRSYSCRRSSGLPTGSASTAATKRR
jgi:hypothetical protein